MNASVRLLERVLPATVALKTEILEGHPSAGILGTERMGSGVVVDRAGLILTVNYVVLGARSVEVALLDDTVVPGRIVAQDFASGIAVVEAACKEPATLPLCRSTDLGLGQEVFIVAAAGDNKRRVNNGMITSVTSFDAYWEYALDRAITTTAMNPGVGGAPLFDTLGRIIGIVSLELGEVGRFTLAIPIDYYVESCDELLRHGRCASRPPRAWVGFYCYTFREHVVIAGVLPGAPGDQAGLKAGDVVLALNGERISGRHELYHSLWKHRPGELIHFQVYRNNQVTQVSVPSGDAEDFFA
jgi:S1-C subfamily serine protease